jgi:hypothetical protein
MLYTSKVAIHTKSKLMKIVVGNPVEGDNFFGREKEQRQLWRKLQTNHLLMLAPRRIGKTSLIKRLRDTAQAHNSKVLYCSFAPCQDEFGCINEIHKAIGDDKTLQKTFTTALSTLKGIKFAGFGIDLKEDNKKHWPSMGEALTLALSKCSQQDQQLIIAVDELPIFILKLLEGDDGENKVRAFLNWFRHLRQIHTKNIKWLLAGSIGLDTITKRLRMGDTINDLQPFLLAEFDDKTAYALIQKLADSYQMNLPQETREYIIKRIGWAIPYYIQVMLDKLVDLKDDSADTITNDDVDEVFNALLGPAYKVHFDYWHQHLTDELGAPQAGYATHLLNHICKDPNGMSKASLNQTLFAKVPHTDSVDEQLIFLLDVLENDGYLILNNQQRYQFRLAWLREYWLKRVAL